MENEIFENGKTIGQNNDSLEFADDQAGIETI